MSCVAYTEEVLNNSPEDQNAIVRIDVNPWKRANHVWMKMKNYSCVIESALGKELEEE